MAAQQEYVFPLALTAEWKEQIQTQTRQKLTEMLGVEVDNVMAEYVVVMVGNKKNMAQIAHDLVDFIGEESAEQFVEWLSQLLRQFEAQQGDPSSQEQPAADRAADSSAPANSEAEKEDTPQSSESKRVISLKGISSSSSAPNEKKVVSLSSNSNRGSIRSLNASSKDALDVLARRSQRFGVVDKPLPERKSRIQQPEQKRDEGRSAGSKRKANDQESESAPPRKTSGGSGGRLSQLLGPPVNVDQAELDARDSLHKKKRSGRSAERDRSSSQPQRSGRNRNDRDDEDGDRSLKRRNDDDGANGPRKRRQEDNDNNNARECGRDVAPPLPPPDDLPGNGRNDRFGPNGHNGPQMGMFNGPPGYGGFPPPYGAPMFYPPPGFGPPPYGMGFPPQGMPPQQYGQFPPQGAPMSLGPRPFAGPRAPRPFQNRKWVNPNIVKSEAPTEDGNAGKSEDVKETSGAGLNANAPAYAPRNPYYSSQMRPRFQNKTWVRQDTAKEEELSSSLPKTPPQESLED